MKVIKKGDTVLIPEHSGVIVLKYKTEEGVWRCGVSPEPNHKIVNFYNMSDLKIKEDK